MLGNLRTNFIYHITFRMPALVPHVSIYLHKLFEDGATAPSALGCEAGGIVKMTIYVTFMLIIRILRPKQSRT